MVWTRRQLLTTLTALGVASAGGTALVGSRWWARPAGQGLSVLSDDEHEFLQAVAEAWMPRGGEPEVSGADANLGVFMDQLLAQSDESITGPLKALFQVLDDTTRATHLSAYRHLPLDARREVLRGWLVSDVSLFRRAVHGMMALLSMGWSQHPDVIRVLRPSFACGWGG